MWQYNKWSSYTKVLQKLKVRSLSKQGYGVKGVVFFLDKDLKPAVDVEDFGAKVDLEGWESDWLRVMDL